MKTRRKTHDIIYYGSSQFWQCWWNAFTYKEMIISLLDLYIIPICVGLPYHNNYSFFYMDLWMISFVLLLLLFFFISIRFILPFSMHPVMWWVNRQHHKLIAITLHSCDIMHWVMSMIACIPFVEKSKAHINKREEKHFMQRIVIYKILYVIHFSFFLLLLLRSMIMFSNYV